MGTLSQISSTIYFVKFILYFVKLIQSKKNLKEFTQLYSDFLKGKLQILNNYVIHYFHTQLSKQHLIGQRRLCRKCAVTLLMCLIGSIIWFSKMLSRKRTPCNKANLLATEQQSGPSIINLVAERHFASKHQLPTT